MTMVNRLEPGQAPDPSWYSYTAKLDATPYEVPVGGVVELSGSSFAPGALVELVWYSVTGRYEANPGGEFVGQRYDSNTSVIATAVADAEGKLTASLTVPLDFGGMHDIRARVDGVEVAQSGVLVTATWSMTPTEGPIGTPVEIRVTGLDYDVKVNTWHLLWDNHYFGMITGVTTRGVGTARFRAAGPVGVHHIASWRNSHSTSPYLAGDYSPLRNAGKTGIDFTFTVTEDPGVLAGHVDDFAETADLAGASDGSASLAIEPNRGVVESETKLSGSGLPAGAELDLVWFTHVGASVMNIEPREIRNEKGTVQTDAEGAFSIDFQVPDDLGGAHRIAVFHRGEELASTTFVILPSIVSCTPEVRAGERVDIHLKGVGWTEYDKNYAVTYDNSFIGYVCALSTAGTIRFRFTATGQPGTHLLDLYPMIYKAKDAVPVVNGVPNLTYTDDHPIRRTPGIRLAIRVTD